MNRPQALHWRSLIVLTVVSMGIGANFAQAAEEPACEGEPLLVAAADSGMSSTGETAHSSGNVEERAVPRMGPGGIAPGVKPGTAEGAILEKGRLRVQPGYVLQQQADGSVMARKAGGSGGGGGTFSCFCALGRGGCKMIVQGGEAWCRKSDSNPCSNTCDMKISKFSVGPAVIQ
jgi:hypothetical protein